MTAPCLVTCLLFPFLSFRLFHFTLSLPFPELPLAFLAFVVGENIREDAPGNVFNLVLRNTGIVDELLLAAQAGCSLRFDMKFLRCSCGRADDLLLRHGSFLKKRKMQALVKLRLDRRLHFAWLYYSILGAGVNSTVPYTVSFCYIQLRTLLFHKKNSIFMEFHREQCYSGVLDACKHFLFYIKLGCSRNHHSERE